MKSRALALCVGITLLLAPVCFADGEGTDPGGTVSLPFHEYRSLLERLKEAELAELLEELSPPEPAEGLPPAEFTVTKASFAGRVDGDSASINGTIKIRVLRDRWVKVPLMSTSAVLQSVKLNDQETTLLTEGQRYHLATKKAGEHTLELEMVVPVKRSGTAGTCSLSLPPSTITVLEVALPGGSHNVVINPALVSHTRESGQALQVRAVIPVADGVSISWAGPSSEQYNLYRADYVGRLAGGSALFTAELRVEINADAVVDVPFLSTAAGLDKVSLDGAEAAVRIDEGQFLLPVRGPGRFTIKVSFALPVAEGDGPESVEMEIPRCPVSTLRFTVPGNRSLTVSPALGLEVESGRSTSTASATLPIVEKATITWINEIPLADVETRTHLSSTQVVSVGEGVIRLDCHLDVEVLRGQTDTLTFSLPRGTAILSVDGRGIRDWRTSQQDSEGDRLSIYLNRRVEGRFPITVRAETLAGELEGLHPVPFIRGGGFEREKGVVALLRSEDFKLSPAEVTGLARVDSGQIPSPVRSQLGGEVLYTYKFLQTPYALSLEVRAPDAVEARVAAVLNSLATLREDVLAMRTVVELEVTRSPISRVELTVPESITVVGVEGANILDWNVDPGAGTLAVELKDRQKGRVVFSVRYDQRIDADQTKIEVPTIGVAAAWSESGFIGVEKVGSLEIGAERIDNLSPVDAAQLPPSIAGSGREVLLAFRYPRRPFRLALTMTTHQEMAVPTAFIDTANYMSLVTAEGVLLTEAHYQVRNWKSQFLKLTLPPSSELWSALVDEQPVQPVEDEHGQVLIPLRTSKPKIVTTDGHEQTVLESYPVKVVFRNSTGELGRFGSLDLALPDVDIRVSEMIWSLYLPDGYRYRGFEGNVYPMTVTGHRVDLAQAGSYDKEQLARQISGRGLRDLQGETEPQQQKAAPSQQRRQEVSDMLMYNQVLLESSRLQAAHHSGGGEAHAIRIVIPRQGKLYRFSKLYPTESEDPPSLSAGYADQAMARTATPGIVVLTVIVFTALGLAGLGLSRRVLGAVLGCYAVAAVVTWAVIGLPVIRVALVAGVCFGVGIGLSYLRSAVASIGFPGSLQRNRS